MYFQIQINMIMGAGSCLCLGERDPHSKGIDRQLRKEKKLLRRQVI
jgi:hypothetical protein